MSDFDLNGMALLRRIADTLDRIEQHLRPTWTLNAASPPTCTHSWRLAGTSTAGSEYVCDECGSRQVVL